MKEATDLENGQKERTCECGHKEIETIPKTEKPQEPIAPDNPDPNPPTDSGDGDKIDVSGCGGFVTDSLGVLAAVFAASALLIWKRKRKA